ncbi:hypothetical protein DL766_007190 [Monosporascus sp. MC13-8B]|uniref:DUF829 domain-containing protein n=1 Tax=Monosporascus cannonballus TaxID=155416 RepID=A0ABY0H002_9PEZI|nr:hypothetical protein DL762_007296 [Monosporascus cannonballus]RYO94541.1 hypothetical protein DL763_004048 [Monosporascus cannonballus]RYP24923.1 hypothetical protein DL766_007190 [Monosporascus sp. MC13-8B]
MAYSQPAATSAKPLAMMRRLSPYVSYYKAPKLTGSPGSGAATSAPKLILLASWMDAQDAHIAKYITYYQTIYPTSTILLVIFTGRLLWSPAMQNSAAQPAASYVRSQVDSGALSAAPREPEVLVHVFSNGGATSMRNIYEVYRRKTGRAFPPHAAVYDSCPGRWSAVRTYHVLTLGLRGLVRLLLGPLLALLVAAMSIWYGPLGFLAGEDMLTRTHRIHNDRTLVRQTNRSYVYSKEDAMVGWRHIEEHARDAAAKGIPVRREMYQGSAHVTHMRTDDRRYWKIVTDTWEESIKRSGTLLPGFT